MKRLWLLAISSSLLILIKAAFPYTTGTIKFIDNKGNSVSYFSLDADTAYIEVQDKDEVGSVEVKIKSSLETESMILTEQNSGIFSGVISLIRDNTANPGDGRLNTYSVDTISGVYIDEKDDWGNSKEVSTDVGTGLVDKDIKWTAENGPYIIAGTVKSVTDPGISTDYWGERLIIFPGTVIKFKSGRITKDIVALGTEKNKVSFLLYDKSSSGLIEPYRGVFDHCIFDVPIEPKWGFLASNTLIFYSNIRETISLSTNRGGTLFLSNNNITAKEYGLLISSDKYTGVAVKLSYNNFNSSPKGNVYLYYGTGSFNMFYNSFINSSYGLFLVPAPDAYFKVNYNNIANNSLYDLSVPRREGTKDFRYNWWGYKATAEMDAGDNPKNISTIEDCLDDSPPCTEGYVNYSNWLSKPVDITKGPVADGGPDHEVEGFVTVTLGGSNSYDPDGNEITYKWELVSKPLNSRKSLPEEAGAHPKIAFTPDVVGYYLFMLTVNNGTVDSVPDLVSVDVKEVQTPSTPYIKISANKSSLVHGDTLNLFASAGNNSGKDIYADVFLGIITPAGQVYFFNRDLNLVPCIIFDARTYTSFATNVYIPTGFTLSPTRFYSINLPDYVPAGTYQAFAAMTVPGSTKNNNTKLIGEISFADLVLQE